VFLGEWESSGLKSRAGIGERPTPSIKPQQRARNIFWKGEEAFHHRAKALHVLRQRPGGLRSRAHYFTKNN